MKMMWGYDGLTAVMEAAGRDAAGSGSAKAAIAIAVNAQNGFSTVRVGTNFSAIRRAAGFGGGVREDALRWAW
jgi:hypothetical protein